MMEQKSKISPPDHKEHNTRMQVQNRNFLIKFERRTHFRSQKMHEDHLCSS